MNQISKNVFRRIEKAKQQLAAAADRTQSQIDDAREPVADKMHAAADAIRDRAKAVTGVAETAADRLDASASYLDSHDSQRIMKDLFATARKHPTKTLLVAGTIGFLISRVLRKNGRTAHRL